MFKEIIIANKGEIFKEFLERPHFASGYIHTAPHSLRSVFVDENAVPLTNSTDAKTPRESIRTC